jgi:hypothetical protein
MVLAAPFTPHPVPLPQGEREPLAEVREKGLKLGLACLPLFLRQNYFYPFPLLL